MKKKKVLMALLLAYGLILSGCSQKEEDSETVNTETQEMQSASQEVFAMDTYMTVTAYGENAEEAVEESIQEIQRLDTLLSATAETGEVYTVNHSGGGVLSEDSIYLLERSLELYEDTKGAFNVAIFPVMEAWGFVTDEFAVPDATELQEKLGLANVEGISVDSKSSSITYAEEGMAIDFGGIAKGYTSTRVADIFKDMGIENGLINLGGNVHLVGTKTDGTKWKVGIQSPDDENEYIGVLAAQDCAVITSGGYERYFEEDGVVYHHIIDPSTGYPAANGLISVTIVSKDGTLADGLSTSLYIMGLEKAEEFWREHSEEFDAILLTEENELYVTEGIAEDFTSDLDVKVIEKEK